MLPATAVAPMEMEAPMHILALAATAAAGRGFTLIVTEFDFVQPVAVVISVRV